MSNKISALVGLGTLRRYRGLSGRSGDTVVCAFRWQRTCGLVGGQSALLGYCAGGTLRRYHVLWTGCGFPTSAG